MTDLFTIIIDVEIGLLFLVGFYAVWRKLGGWPEAYYRIAQIPYFVQWVWGPTREPGRWVHKTEIIDTKKKSFRCNEKDWQLNEEAMGRDTGRPAWYYLYDETEPLPIFKFKEGAKMTPDMITAAYENDCIERVHRIGQGRRFPLVLMFMLAILIVIIIVMIGVYFNYNTYCAVTPEKCGTGGGVRIS
jgi:hypothetical protein